MRITGHALAAMLTSSLAQPNELQAFNFGKHTGIVTWAYRYCGAEPTATFLWVAQTTKRQNPPAFNHGFNKGFADGVVTRDKDGISAACTYVRTLYRPRGFNVPDAIE